MTTALITVAGAIIVAAGGWVVAIVVRREQTAVERHAKSGTIRSSEAAELWAEATKIREYQADQLGDRDEEIARLAVEVADCKRACEETRREAEECKSRERVLEARLAAGGL